MGQGVHRETCWDDDRVYLYNWNVIFALGKGIQRFTNYFFSPVFGLSQFCFCEQPLFHLKTPTHVALMRLVCKGTTLQANVHDAGRHSCGLSNISRDLHVFLLEDLSCSTGTKVSCYEASCES